MNVTSDSADQMELIFDDQVTAWLGLSRCTTLTVVCFLYYAAVAPPDRGDSVRPIMALAAHKRGYFDARPLDVVVFYNKPDSNSDVPEDPSRQAKLRRTCPRSNVGWQRRIHSHDYKVN